MLVLSRSTRERILIEVGDTRVWVSLVATRPGQARIGVDAPRHVKIVREECITEFDDCAAIAAGTHDVVSEESIPVCSENSSQSMST